MLIGPRYVYRLPWCEALRRLEHAVPGAYVRGWAAGRWWGLKRVEQPEQLQHWQVEVAWHSGWRVAEELDGSTVESVTSGDVTEQMFVTDPEWLLDYGRALARHAVERGELREDALGKLTSYQLRTFALAATRPTVYLRWCGGGGKTAGGLCAIMAREGPAVVLCPGGARKAWRWRPEGERTWPTSVEKFTWLETHRLLPESERSKSYEPLPEYLQRMRESRKRPVVVVGMESLRYYLSEVRQVDPSVLVIDEVHNLGSTKRVDVETDSEGRTRFRRAKTDGGETTMVLAAVELAHRTPTLQLRVGMTGTPIDASMRRVWSQLDVLSPGGAGHYSRFRVRHCAFRLDEDGYPDDSGASREDELRRRCSFFFSDVPREVTHAELPPLRLEGVYLAQPDRKDVPEDERQNRPDAFVDEMRQLARAARSAAGGRGRLREAGLAEACSRKRRAVLLWTEETVREGGKVVVLLTRKPMVERWAEGFRAAMPGVTGWAVTGDDSERVRDDAIDAFAVHPGPCWLLGTGHSIGTSKDGMQCAQLAVIAQLPEKVGLFLQWVWRFDRLAGVGTIVRVPVAEGTADDHEVTRIVRNLGPIERFTDSPELRSMAEALDGAEDDALLDDLVAPWLAKSER